MTNEDALSNIGALSTKREELEKRSPQLLLLSLLRVYYRHSFSTASFRLREREERVAGVEVVYSSIPEFAP